jgi:molecular chaperone DnaJ
MPITVAQAILGADITVPTIDGKVSYPVHEGTQPGDVFKLKGKGIPHLNGRGRGDQYVKMNIEIPKNLNSKQKNQIKDFDATLGDKNFAKQKSFREKLKKMFGD